MQAKSIDTCGIPSKANWHTEVIFSHRGETSYTDVYSCDEHFPGYPDGSMSESDAASLLLWDGHESAEILEWTSAHLRTSASVTEPEPVRPARLTTRSGWWTYTDVLKNRQPFRTSGALSGGAPTGSTGRLPADWRNLYQTGADYVIYSYATPIAWHRPADNLWIVPDERYSVTTSRHQSLIGTAVSQLQS